MHFPRQGIDVVAEALAQIRGCQSVAVDDQVHGVLHQSLCFLEALGRKTLFRVAHFLVQVADQIGVFRGQSLYSVALRFVLPEECLDTVDVVDHIVVLVDRIAFGIESLGLVDIATEGSEFIVVLNGQRTVHVHDPLAHIAGHVVETVVVGGVLVDVHGDVSKIIQSAGHTHVVTISLDEVGIDGTVSSVAAVSIPDEVTVPRVGLALSHKLA